MEGLGKVVVVVVMEVVVVWWWLFKMLAMLECLGVGREGSLGDNLSEMFSASRSPLR
jgi:hypothetical protein